jgi:hypothetical protein
MMHISYQKSDILALCTYLKEQGVRADNSGLRPLLSAKSYATTLKKIKKNKVSVEDLRTAPNPSYTTSAGRGKLSKYYLVSVVSRPISDMPLLVNSNSKTVAAIAKWRIGLGAKK